MRISLFVSTSAGVRKETWDKMSNKEKAAYVVKHPKSKYATDGKVGKAKSGTKLDKKINNKVDKGFQIKLDWGNAKTKRDVLAAIKDINKESGAACTLGKIKTHGDNGYPEAYVIGKSKAEILKFVDAYSGGEAEEYEDSISKVK